ncbi:MAG: hypothetical protein V4585_03295 [Bacteroidota bacterium]
MEKSYQNISYFFIGVLLCAFVGFHFTYTVKFPNFEGLSAAHHFHGAMLMSWFFMLIVQPILIRMNKREWHRQLGKVSYLQIPLLLFSIFLVTKAVYFKNLSLMPRPVVIGGLSLDIIAIFAFGFFYIMAMVNKKNTASHLRYMIGTSLLMIGPGVGRALIIFGGIPFPIAIIYTMFLSEIIAIIFILFDYFKGASIKPFLVILTVLIASHLCWSFQMASWWQTFGEWFVRIFF